MSVSPIENAADLFQLTQEYVDKRHEALVRDLGEKTLWLAIDEDHLESELLDSLTQEEEIDYLLMQADTEYTSASVAVEDAIKQYDHTLFTAASVADTGNHLRGYRIEGVEPGQITLMDGRRSPWIMNRGDHYGIKGIVRPETMELTIHKVFFKRGSSMQEVVATNADYRIVYAAANLLKPQLPR